MTVSSEQSRVQYATDGVATSFPVPFRFLRNRDLRVTLIQDQDGTTHELVLDSDYMLSGANQAAGGTLTTTTTLAAGQTLIVERVMSITQETAYQRNDPFPERAHEQALDRLTMIAQQFESWLGTLPGALPRVLHFPIEFPRRQTTLPPAHIRARKALIFDALGNVTVGKDNYDDQAANAAQSASEAAQSASTAHADRQAVEQIANDFGDLDAARNDWETAVQQSRVAANNAEAEAIKSATSATDSRNSAIDAARYAGATPFETVVAMRAAEPMPAGSRARVWGDTPDLNGLWTANASEVFVRDVPQPANQSDVDELRETSVGTGLQVQRKLDEHSSPAPGVLASITDKDGRPTFMTARDTDGAPADVATHLIGLVLGLLFEPTPGYMLALVDAQRRMTDLAIRDSDGQFDDFVVDRLAPRIAQRLNPQNLGKVIPFPQVIGSDHPVSGSDFYMRDGELLPVLSNMARFAGWGSSSMSRSSTALNALAVSLGATYFDGAVSGQGSEQISARLGAVPAFCTFPNNMIPAGTEEISIVVPDIGWHAGQDYTGTINGVHGRLRYSGGPKFSRTTAGEPVLVPPNTPFLPDDGAQNRASITFLWMGRNDLSGTDDRTESCIKNTDASFDWLAPLVKRALVLGHFKGDLTSDSSVWDRIERVNAAHRMRYGRLFVDVDAYLISPQVWVDMGLTPTQQDLDQQTVGTTPASLRVDGLHLTNAAYQAVVTHCVRARMVELGWI
ncbi:hypothetical protein [Alcaligenes aquatilis]|uniref:hypothetical protein n=1 Tax=Alcaligenes aquatilis TaxID=323284 RepID=UPI00361F7CD9